MPGITFVSSFSIVGISENDVIIPTHFCITTNGEFVITDRLQNCLRVFSRGGKFLIHIGIGILKSVWNVISLPNGNVLVSDTSDANIKEFKITGEYVKCFFGNVSMMAPSGLAIDKKNHILVSGKGQQIWIYNYEGQLEQVIQGTDKNIPEWSQYLAVCNDLVVLSNETECTITCFDYEGSCLFDNKMTDLDQQCSPNGVCIDKYDNILIADRDGNNINMFNKKGLYLGTILNSKDDLENPIALTFNKNNELVILELGGDIKIFKYKL